MPNSLYCTSTEKWSCGRCDRTKELYYEFLHQNLAVDHLAIRAFQHRTSLASPQHLHILQDMLKDFALGEHLLLVGNQVGLHPHQ